MSALQHCPICGLEEPEFAYRGDARRDIAPRDNTMYLMFALVIGFVVWAHHMYNVGMSASVGSFRHHGSMKRR